MKVLAFAASNSKQSINRTLAAYTAGMIEGAEVEVLDIQDYEMPIFSEEREEELGQPEEAQRFFQKIGDADAIIVSYAEHNGSYSAAYKNLFDWASRINTKVFQNTPMLILAASPGPGGAANVLSLATSSAPHFAGDVRGSISLPSFHQNFDMEANEVTNPDIRAEIEQGVQMLSAAA